MPHTMHRRIVTGRNTEMYTTYSSVGCSVGVGVGVAMGVMVGVANVAVREIVAATKRKQRNMVKRHFHWYKLCVGLRTKPLWSLDQTLCTSPTDDVTCITSISS